MTKLCYSQQLDTLIKYGGSPRINP